MPDHRINSRNAVRRCCQPWRVAAGMFLGSYLEIAARIFVYCSSVKGTVRLPLPTRRPLIFRVGVSVIQPCDSQKPKNPLTRPQRCAAVESLKVQDERQVVRWVGVISATN